MLKELSLSRLAKPSGPKAQKGKPQLKDELQNRSFWLRRKEGWREGKEGRGVGRRRSGFGPNDSRALFADSHAGCAC